MRAYVIRRLLLTIPTLIILSMLVFLSVRFIPGDIVDVLMQEMMLTGAIQDVDRGAVERRLGLDQPIHVQYGRWVGDILLRGSLGRSLLHNWEVGERILGRMPVTFELGLLAIVIGLVIAIPVGIFSAIRQDRTGDYVGRSVAIIGLATPNFWLGVMVMIYPAIWWGWTPPLKLVPFFEDPLRNLGGFLIPALILGTAGAAAVMRMTRTMMLGRRRRCRFLTEAAAGAPALPQDYIRTAWSKGVRERVVVVRHALKNALIPVVTLVGLQLPILVGGAVIMENIFNLPGLGRLMLLALQDRDYTVVSGVNLLFGTVVLLNNLFIDVVYGLLDPRIRYR